MLQNMNCIEGR